MRTERDPYRLLVMDAQRAITERVCGDADPEVHRVLTGKVFPCQAEVTTVDEWISGLS
ncbi:hypothetical protein ACIPPM_04430 [Streptomyces sp. NPDC090119]|uniref:hypothetical protein n=1 Tax=Streptomyces sp. NPDC090119 TaxID=3365951 RepID=UPI00380ED063